MAEFVMVVVGTLIGFVGILITGTALEGSDMNPRLRVMRGLLGIAILTVAGVVWYLAPSFRT